MNNIPHLDWQTFQSKFQRLWRQSEHVVVIGPTGSGKTQLLRNIANMRTYCTILATKPYDKSMVEICNMDGYSTFSTWPINLSAHQFPKRILWPDASSLNSVRMYQRPAFELAFEHIYVVGGWTLAIDELWFFTNVLKLASAVKLYLTQARAMYITLITCSQRTAWVPVEVFNQSTHHFYFAENDERNLNVIAGIAYRRKEEIRDTIADLPRHHFLYFNKLTGECYTSVIRTKGHTGVLTY
jgi:energy-coupling factor transporter ATP-binding protein EcfA2